MIAKGGPGFGSYYKDQIYSRKGEKVQFDGTLPANLQEEKVKKVVVGAWAKLFLIGFISLKMSRTEIS